MDFPQECWVSITTDGLISGPCLQMIQPENTMLLNRANIISGVTKTANIISGVPENSLNYQWCY